jgi:hypothetical protein
MKLLVRWSLRPGAMKKAAQRFLAGEATAPEGVTLLGRWHKADGTGGYSLVETSNPTALYADAAKWTDELELSAEVVIEDGDAAPILAKAFGK